MFCNKCGQEIQNERGFCSRCNINPTPEMPSFPDTALAWWKILLIWIFVFCCPVLGSIIVIILSAILYYAKRKTYPRRANSLLVNGWLILIFGLALSYNRLQNGGFYMCKYPNFILQCSDIIDCFSQHDSPMQDGPKKHIPRARIEGTVRLSPRLDNFLLKDWCKDPCFTISHCLPLTSSEIDFIWRPILECRMNPPGVVKIHIMLNAEAKLRQADVLLDFDVLIFQRPPETFHLCII